MDECVMETSSPTEASSDLNFNMDDEKVQSQEQRSSTTAVAGAADGSSGGGGGDNQNAAGVCYWYAHMQREVLFDICSTFKYIHTVHF